jgi:hypothetical protein
MIVWVISSESRDRDEPETHGVFSSLDRAVAALSALCACHGEAVNGAIERAATVEIRAWEIDAPIFAMPIALMEAARRQRDGGSAA